MFDKWLNLPAHLYLRITALTILTVGIALSNVLMSIGAIWIISNWLIQADFKLYWEKFKQKPSVWLVVALFFFLAFSLIWSADFSYGFKDLRVKLPFIVIPLVMATSAPLAQKHFYFLLYVFLGIVTYTSAYNFIRYNYFLDDSADIREMSTFISHIRFSVLINFAIFICVYFIYKRKYSPFLWVGLMGWFLIYLYISQIISGYLLFVVLTPFTVVFFSLKIRSKVWRSISIMSLVLGVFIAGFMTFHFVEKLNHNERIDYESLEFYSPNNNPYYHDTTNKEMENGQYVWMYVSQEEMEREWAKRSAIPYDSLDNKGQPMFGTLMRYLTSKGLRKDSVGVASLTPEEVVQIENGQTSIDVNKGLETRLKVFLTEYRIYEQGGDPNGNSLIQRVEHFKAALGIISQKWLLGVGVGDVPQAFEDEYAKMNSRLFEENRHRSHNQFLTIWVSLGILGFVLFSLMLILPFFEIRRKDYFMIMIFIGLIVSSLFQDIIETQAGVTIFALFYALALYREPEEIKN